MKINKREDGIFSAFGSFKGRKIVCDSETFIGAMTSFHETVAELNKEFKQKLEPIAKKEN